jgi:hypothetical protein
MLPLDQGTIILMNKVAARGPPLPKNLKMIFKGVEVEDEGGADDGDKAMQDRYDTEGLKIVSDAGSSLPDGMDSEPTVIDYGEQDIIGIHDSIDTVMDHSQQLEPPQDVSEAHVPEAECDVGTSDTGISAVEPRPVVESPIPGSPAYHVPDQEHPPSRQIPPRPWFLSGSPVMIDTSGGRPTRDRRAVQRYDPSAFAALILSNSHPHQLSQIRPILEKDRRMSASWSESAHVLTVEKALKTMGKRAQSSITKEMRSMVEKRVFVPVVWANLTPEQRASTIQSSMF